MNSQDYRNLQEAYLDVYENEQLDESGKNDARIRGNIRSFGSNYTPPRDWVQSANRGQGAVLNAKQKEKQRRKGLAKGAMGKAEVEESYDLILSHLLDEGYAETPEAAEAIMVNMSEDWKQDIMEKEDSEYEKASDAALDKRYGYGRASGDKRSFGRAANRSSAAAALRAIRRGERSGSGTSREAGSDAVHQGWAKTAKTSTDQTPEKKEKRKKLADTSYSNLPDDEKEKDRVSFDAVRAIYNKNKK